MCHAEWRGVKKKDEETEVRDDKKKKVDVVGQEMERGDNRCEVGGGGADMRLSISSIFRPIPSRGDETDNYQL